MMTLLLAEVLAKESTFEGAVARLSSRERSLRLDLVTSLRGREERRRLP